MRKKIVAAAVLAAGLSAVAAVPYKLGVAGYMFAKGGLDWALTVMHETDCRYLCHKGSKITLEQGNIANTYFAIKGHNAGKQKTN
jgi:hypothetical protein